MEKTVTTSQQRFNNPTGATEGDLRAYDPACSQTTPLPDSDMVKIEEFMVPCEKEKAMCYIDGKPYCRQSYRLTTGEIIHEE